MPAVARLTDVFTDTDVIATGSGNVFVNGLPVARLTDMTTGHSLPGHTTYPPVPITVGSGSVFVNGLPIARLGDKHDVHCDTGHPASDCHDAAISSASGNVFAG